MGPWLANTIRACDGLTSMMAYWTFSDVFEEGGVVKTPFYGGFGLIAERGIPKAAFRVFELLHNLGNQRLDSDSEDALITKKPDGTLVLAIWNYGEPDRPGAAKTIQLRLRNGRKPKYRMQFVAPEHGSALETWNRIGKPDLPTRDQIAQLLAASQMAPATEHSLTEPIHLAPYELALVQLKP
jgi:xylan 1,4-beta-xylosidase